MIWLLPSVIATLAATVVLAMAYAYLYTRDREASIGIWTVGWAIYALRFVAQLLDLILGERFPGMSPYFLISTQLTSLLSGALLLWGTYVWHRRRFPNIWIWVAALCGLWIIIAILRDLPFWLLALPTFTLMGLIYLGAGVMILQHQRTGQLGEKITAWTLILWGLHKIDYPFLRPVEGFAPWGYLIGAIFSLISAIGIILIYFEDARQALTRSEARFRGVFETSPTGIAIVDVATQRFLDTNPSYQRILGYTGEALRHLTVADVTHSDDWETEGSAIRRHIDTRQPRTGYDLEKRYLHKDGTIRWARVTGDVMRLGPEESLIAVANVEDITDRRRAEARIRHLNRLLRAIRNVNQLIARERDRGRLIQGACESLIETRDYHSAWIALVKDGGTVANVAAASAHTDAQVLRQRITDGKPVHCLNLALTQEDLHVIADPATVCADCPLVSTHKETIGLTVQLHHDKKVYGVLTVAVAPTFAKDEEEQNLLEEVAGDLSLALHDIEEEAHRRQAETEREAAIKALRQSEEKFRLIAEASAEDIWQLDVNGHVTYVSPAVKRIFGYTPEEAIQLGFDAFFPTSERGRARDAFIQAIAGEPYQLLIFTGQRKDGLPVPIEVSVTPIIQDDIVIGVQGIARDISHRRQAEGEREAALQALRTSEQKYRTLFEEALNPILMVDEAGRYIDANAAALDFLECDRETLVQQSVWDYSPPDLLEQQQTKHAPFLGHRTLETEYVVNGAIKTLLLNVVPVEIEGRAILYGIGQDITERKRAEAAQERLTQQMEQILATVPAGVLLLNAQRRVVQANPQARQELDCLAHNHWETEPLTNLGDRALDDLLTSPPTPGAWHEIQAGQRIFEAIARPVLPNAVLGDNGGRRSQSSHGPQHWVLVMREVTQERIIERHIQQQERLAAVGQLAAGIAHDFNNIMAVMVLYTQMAMNTPTLPTKTLKRLEIVVDQAKRATALIQQILEFSRRAVLERQPMDLKPFLKEIVKLLQRTLPESITIDLTYDRDTYIVDADPTRMQQALLNLAVNARDAMPEGGALHLSLSRAQASSGARCMTCGERIKGEWIWLEVADTGTGIAPDVLEHIFEPFFTTKPPGAGTGLGLAQVFGLVKQHKGHITVDTEVGKGTTFTLYLPALLEAAPVKETTAPSPLIEGRGETILVVEDDAPLRQALVESLTALNYRILAADSGHAALDMVDQLGDEIALILSDMVMPGMGGQGLFHTLRERGIMTPMIVLSGHPLEKELQAMQDQGLAAWMLKPPNIEELAHILAQVLRDRGL